MCHDLSVHRQDPVSFPEPLALGRGAWIHPAHDMVSLAQLLLQVEPKTLFLLLAQQTEARPVQVPGIWGRKKEGSKKEGGEHSPGHRSIK